MGDHFDLRGQEFWPMGQLVAKPDTIIGGFFKVSTMGPYSSMYFAILTIAKCKTKQLCFPPFILEGSTSKIISNFSP